MIGVPNKRKFLDLPWLHFDLDKKSFKAMKVLTQNMQLKRRNEWFTGRKVSSIEKIVLIVESLEIQAGLPFRKPVMLLTKVAGDKLKQHDYLFDYNGWVAVSNFTLACSYSYLAIVGGSTPSMAIESQPDSQVEAIEALNCVQVAKMEDCTNRVMGNNLRLRDERISPAAAFGSK